MITSVLIIVLGLMLSKSRIEQSVLLSKIKNNKKNYQFGFSRIIQIILLIMLLTIAINSKTHGQNCTGVSPDFIYVANNNGCHGTDTLSFQNRTTGANANSATYYWKSGSTVFDTTVGLSAPGQVILNPGTHSLELIVKNGSCYDTTHKTISIYNAPVIGFSIFEDTICLGSPVHFTNNSTKNNNWSYSWSFGDGFSSNKTDTVSHIYKGDGTYTVALTVTTNYGCSFTSTHKVWVVAGNTPLRFYDNYGNPQPTMMWSRCINLITDPDSFTQSFASFDTLSNYVIDFGDGTTSSGTTLYPYPFSNITHTYQNLGVYDFTVTSMSYAGCTKVFSGKVINLRVPTVGIGGPHHGNQNGCIPFSVGFKNTTSNVSYDTRFTWNFGDSETANFDTSNVNDSVYHNYTTSACDIYVTLTATNMCGNTQATWGPVNAYARDEADISPDSVPVCHPNYVANFSNRTNYNCYNGEKLFYWDFGDSSNTGWTNVGVGRSHTYSEPGVYEVKFIDSNLCGTDTAFAKVVAFPAVEAKFDFLKSNISCINSTFNFIDSCKGENLSYNWNFGDGTSSTLAEPSHTYTDTGIFNVTLIVTGSCGKDTAIKTIEIYKKPVASFTNIRNGCAPYRVSPLNNSRDLSPYANYTWSIGRFNPVTSFHPGELYYPVPGNYSLRLIVNDVCGNDTFLQAFSVYGNPTADFVADNVCFGDSTTLTSTSTDANGVIVRHFWDYGNGYTQNISNVKRVFTNQGTFSVGLAIESSTGCKDTVRKNITVLEKPVANISLISNSTICSVNEAQFAGSANINSGNIDSFLWSYSDGQSDTGQYVSHQFLLTGNQAALLTVRADNGCSNTALQTVNILESPSADFSVESVCFGETSRFIDQTSIQGNDQIAKYYWDFNNDGVAEDSSQNPYHLYTMYGGQQARLIVKSLTGCMDTIVKTVYVHRNPDVRFSMNSTTACQNTNAVFVNNSIIADTFIWNFGDGTSAMVKNDNTNTSHIYSNPGSYYVKLTARNIYNCIDKDSIQVSVASRPNAMFSISDTFGCAPVYSSFTNQSTFADSFRWYKNNIFQTTANTMNALTMNTAGDTSTIKLIAFNDNSCPEDTFEKQIITVYNPVSSFTVNNDRGCSPLSVSFTNTSQNALNYYWDFGNGDTSQAENPSYNYTNNLNRDTFYLVTLVSYSAQNCMDSITDTVFVYSSPVASFIASTSEGCGPLSVQFTNNSIYNNSTANLTYNWNLGNGNVSGSQNASTNYLASNYQDSIYQVTLSVQNSHGCSANASESIKVFPKPKVDFSAPSFAGCGPFNVSLTNTSSPKDSGNINMMNFTWDLGNGVSNNNLNNQVNYFSSLTNDTVYQVKLVGYSEHNCVDSISKSIKVYPKPSISFSSNISHGCGPLNVQFTNSSNPNDTGNISIMNFTWDFDNGQIANTQNATQSFAADNFNDTVYQVKLVGYNEHNCSDSVTKSIRVYPTPQVSFTVNNQNGCGPLSVTFTNTSSPKDTGSINLMNFAWDFNNGIQSNVIDTSLVFQPAAQNNKTYQVALTGYSEHNCVATTSKAITVYPIPNVSFTSNTTNGCGPLAVSFLNNSNPMDSASSINQMTFNWNFGDGENSSLKNPAHTFNASNFQDSIYNVVLTGYSQYMCANSDTQSIRVYPLPSVDFTVNQQNGCHPLSISLTNLSDPKDTGSINDMTFLWNLGNGQHSSQTNPSATFTNTNNQPTFYTINLTGNSEHNCTATASKYVTVNPSPDVSFTQTALNMCEPGMVNFTNQTVSHDQNGVSNMSFVWDFGNNNTYSVYDTSIYFGNQNSSSANFLVALKGVNQYGCADSFISTVNVFTKPVADFSIVNQNNCGDGVIFNNTSATNDSNSLNQSLISWNFGGLYTSTNIHDTVNLIPSYYQDTTYNIVMSIRNTYGCTDTITKTYMIHPKPNIKFQVSNEEICSGNSVSFTNNSSNADSFSWSFGDNNFSNDKNPTHNFNNFENYTKIFRVKLQGFNAYGCPGDTQIRSIIVHPKQSAAIISNVDSGCAPLSLNLFNNSQNSTNFKWYINNQNISGKTNTSALLEGSNNQDSVYEVMLISSNSIGCADTAFKQIKVYKKVVASFDADEIKGCNPLNIKFENKSQGASNYFWDFENGSSSALENPQTTFNNFTLSNKNYEVTLFAVSDRNCFDSAKKSVVVYPNPVSMFTTNITEGCNPLNVSFTNISLLSDTFIWDFDNGEISNNEDENKTFYAPDQDSFYHVKLTAISEYGCKDVYEVPVKVYTQAIASFSHVDSGCSPLTTFFQDNSKHATSWFWDFGDGQYSSQKNPEHIYTDAGEFTVKLRVTNPAGCSDEKVVERSAVVYEKPKADFIADSYYKTFPSSPFSVISKSETSLRHSWNFNANCNYTVNAYNDSTELYIKTNDTGFVDVILTVSNNHCSDQTTRKLVIEQPLPTPEFNIDIDKGCEPLTVSFTNETHFGEKYFWYFGDGDSSLQENPTHTFNSPGTYSVTLVVQNSKGMNIAYERDIIKVHPKPHADFIISPSTAYLPNAKVAMTNISVNAEYLRWNVEGQAEDTIPDPIYVFNDPGFFDVELIATSEYGCIDTMFKEGVIHIDTQATLYMPTAFSPNGDNINDVFKPIGSGLVEDEYSMLVYNRWGQVVFESDNLNEGWDGTFNNQPCELGSYYYSIIIKYASDEKETVKGEIVLLR
jgi:gliding motility-associated-like protein